MKYIISEFQYNLLTEDDSFELYMRRRYSELEKDLYTILKIHTKKICDMGLKMFSNDIKLSVTSIYLDINDPKWKLLFNFLGKAFDKDIEKYYKENEENCI